MKKKIGLIGGGFQHTYSSTVGRHPKYFQWSKQNIEDITCFMEADIVPNMHKHPNIKKFAWVMESTPIIPSVVEEVIKNYKEISENYEFLLSNDRRIISLADNFFYMAPNPHNINTPQIYPKSKLCSMITSDKRMCNEHLYRLEWKERLEGKLDIFGRGINYFDKKEEALADYMFSVTIENCNYETCWTEKILDCFACGTIPIYHGSPDIGNYFNLNGIIILDENFDVANLSEELYYSKKEAVLDNFNRCLTYLMPEDVIWEEYISKWI